MKRHRFVTIAAIALACALASQAAYAQDRFEFKIPFAFVANGKTLPAGDYYLFTNNLQQVVTVEPKNPKGDGAMMPVETRISERKPMTDAELVFDKLDNKSYVAELLTPGEDGFLLLVTKAPHTHHSLKGAHVQK